MSLPENYTALLAHGKGKDATLGQVPLQKPGKNQILVKMAFAPINPTETLTISGAYPLPGPGPYRVGFEGAGTVAAVGEDLTTPFQVGDRVHVRGLGTVGQYILADASVCRKVQEGLSLEEAASHFTNPATVVCMADYVKKNGHKAVIQSAAASALGKMLIRLLKHKGVKSINIVRRDDLFEELKKEGADYVLNSQASDFEAQLKEIAHKENATVSFDAIAGDFTAKILKNQPADSVCAIYGLLGGFDVPNLSVQQFIFEGKTLRGFNVQTYLEKATKAGEGTKLLDEVYGLLPTVLKTNVQKVFKLEEFKEALACYEQNSTKGKVLIQLS